MLAALTNWAAHPEWTYLAIVVVMALESAPLVGFVLPGSATLVALGSLSGAGVSGFVETLACAATGSIIGDSIGYWLGRAGRAAWRARSRVEGQRAETLIRRYGRLGVFAGRFIWLAHVAVPPTAGIAGIRPRDFYLLDTPAATLWCALHLALGHWLAAAWITGEGLVTLGAVGAAFLLVFGLGWWLYRRA